MNLPPLSIPDFALPFAVPHMIHPLLVHFAIALPVVIILFEFVNLIAKRRTIGVISFMLMLLLVVVYFGAYLAGVVDGKEAAKVLSPEAKDALAAHKQLGVYLVYGSVVVLLFKALSAGVQKTAARVVFLLILIGFTLIAFAEGKRGGELVYTYGANVKAVSHTAAPVQEAQAKANSSQQISTEQFPTVQAPETKTPAKVLPAALPENAAKTKGADETHAMQKTEETSVEKAKESTEKVAETVKETSGQAVPKVKESLESAKEKTAETAKKAEEAVKEKATETTQKVEDAVKKAIDAAPEKPAKPITPVETVPAG